MAELLDIVNEKDEVIGQIERDDINKARHVFRTVFVAFYTPDKHIILQRRSMTKKYNPGMLTTTVSGHVESGYSYDESAIKETYEETGVVVELSDLQKVGVMYDGYAMRGVYGYPFDGTVEDLKVEEDEGAGFVSMPIAELRKELSDEPEKFTPFFATEAGRKLVDFIDEC